MRRALIIMGICSSLLSCRAEADFASDLQNIALWLGLAESGGCADIERIAPYYIVALWGIPSRLCTTEQRSGNSYSEYLEIARKEHVLIGQAGEAYRTSQCSDEIDELQSWPSDPALTEPVNSAEIVKTAAIYTNSRWVAVTDPVYEGQNFLVNSTGMTPSAIAASRATSYSEYLSLVAGIYIINHITNAITFDAGCLTEAQDLITLYHPGWLYFSQGDSSQLLRRIGRTRCYYGSAPPITTQNCSTLGPAF